jgi:hypothetical protein
VLSLANTLVAVVAIVAGVISERGRQRHDRELRLRDDRIRAYAAFARRMNWVAAREPLDTRELAEAHSEIELLTDNVPFH